ncbi:DNA recombination protein RmuC [Oceanithermus sp.]
MQTGGYGELHLLLAFLAGALLTGLWAAWRLGRLGRENARLQAELAAQKEKTEWLLGAKDEMAQAFTALAGSSLEASARALAERTRDLLAGLDKRLEGQLGAHKAELDGLVGPLRENLDRLERQVVELEKKREQAYGGLAEQLRSLAAQQRALQQATVTLGQALKSSSTRGNWGELQLQRVVELAGMAEHVDYETQQTTRQGRPDLTVHLPGGGVLPVDAKAPMSAYLEALEAGSESERRARLQEHARQMRARVKELAARDYWRAFARTPEFVVIFVPSEAALAAAFEADGRLLDDALAQRVLPAGPVTLLALLKAVAYGWRQQELSENARRLAEAGRELVTRLDRFTSSLAEVGRGLEKSVAAYNRAVGSYHSRLAPLARRFGALAGAAEAAEPEPVDGAVRPAEEPE